LVEREDTWNRLNIAARTVPGDYVAGSLPKMDEVNG
jgi:hypothetical protein